MHGIVTFLLQKLKDGLTQKKLENKMDSMELDFFFLLTVDKNEISFFTSFRSSR
jgi:hypothetical protein